MKTTLIFMRLTWEIRQILLKINPNYCKDIEEYFEEISIAISEIDTISKTLFTCLGILPAG
jgi:hypothetical protein